MATTLSANEIAMANALFNKEYGIRDISLALFWCRQFNVSAARMLAMAAEVGDLYDALFQLIISSQTAATDITRSGPAQ